MHAKILFVSGGKYGDLYAKALEPRLEQLMPGVVLERVRSSRDSGSQGPTNLSGYDMVIMSEQHRTDALILKSAKDQGVPVILYAAETGVGPSRREAIKVRAFVDRALAVTPLELSAYKEVEIDTEFVGHPLIDIVDKTKEALSQEVAGSVEERAMAHALSQGKAKIEAKTALGFEWSESLIAISPGVDGEDASEMLALMVEGAAEAAAVSTRKVRVVIPDSECYEERLLEELVSSAPRKPKTFSGRRVEALIASDVALVGTGTEALEASIAGAHTITIKRSSWLKRLSSLFNSQGSSNTFHGPTNAILKRALLPELTGAEATAKNITIEIGGLIEGASKEELDKGLSELKELLGPSSTIDKATDALTRTLKRRSE